jgi:trehalose/maltose hydrolase-like predicted phosphorylase
VVPGSLGHNLGYYGPRTAHGSSLSPAITASLLARAGRPDEALAMLRTARQLDLEGLTGMTGAGDAPLAVALAGQAARTVAGTATLRAAG